MRQIVIRHHIPKTREGEYYALPFDVPAGVETLTVSYGYARKGHGIIAALRPSNTVDLGLCNEKGTFLGWSGSARAGIYISGTDASPGYLPCPVNPGTWRILIGAYHIEPQGADVTYTVTFSAPEPRWYFGDMHMHSTASDGAFTPAELGARARKLGLDFISVTDHNNFAENLREPHGSGLTFIPGVEWTHYKGHMNFFGAAAPFEHSFIANSAEEMRAVIGNARERGATISVNHPKCPFCPYLWKDEDAFDLMEIWNGPFTPRNAKAVAWRHELLMKGKRIPIVGGSDFHKPGVAVRLGSPVTAVYAVSPAAADLLSAIRAGRAYVTENVKGPQLDLFYGDVPMGGVARYRVDTPLTVCCTAKRVILATDRGERELRVPNGRIELPVPKLRFAYLKVPSAIPGALRAVSNPIYFKEEKEND